MNKLKLTALAAMLLALAAIVTPAQAQEGSTPTIRILSPADGASISGDRLTLTVRKQNITFAAPSVNAGDKAGQGNYRVFVDGKLATEDFGDVTALPTDTMPQLTRGQHTIEVRLFSNNGTPLAGSQNATIRVNLASDMSYAPKEGKPAIRIVEGPVADGLGHYVIRTETTGYKLDGTRINNRPEPGIGHYHVYLDDGKLANVGVGDISSIPSDINPNLLTPGDHEIYVVLETHTHNPIEGATSQRVKFTVANTNSTTNLKPGDSSNRAGVLLAIFVGSLALLIGLSALFSAFGRRQARPEDARTQQQSLPAQKQCMGDCHASNSDRPTISPPPQPAGGHLPQPVRLWQQPGWSCRAAS